MRSQLIKFYKSKKDFQQFYFHLKQFACPHCKITGCLILHGYLYGYNEKVFNKKIIRGHRIFCSNRNRRHGCGRTFSVLLAYLLKGFTMTAHSLWRFLKNIAKGIDTIQSLRKLNLSFSNTTAYRLWSRFCDGQSRIRAFLLKRCPPPKLPDVNIPVIQTILHIKLVFKRASCPIYAFQEYFQEPFL